MSKMKMDNFSVISRSTVKLQDELNDYFSTTISRCVCLCHQVLFESTYFLLVFCLKPKLDLLKKHQCCVSCKVTQTFCQLVFN